MFETVFICEKSEELKPDLTTIAHFTIQLSYYAMSNLQHPLQSRAGGLFVLVEGVGVDIQRGGGLTVAEDARHRGNIRAARDHQTGGGVPLRYNYDKPEKPRISRVFGYLARFFILFQTEKSSREVVIS